ncbi:MAG: phage N-6-adenine-methyltransferase [Patescibacteria group bacterium]|nr:phage N-6-adenine-methyltransferase [Patescibacteria group bacterium]
MEQTKKPHISYNSGNFEWITPPEIIELSKRVMGEIDLDPSSSIVANQIVGAKKFYTKEENGLLQDWVGKIWMNPPYSSKLISLFADKFVQEVEKKNIQEAMILVNNATETKWFEKLSSVCGTICFLYKRVAFLDKNLEAKSKPLQGQVIFYYGKNAHKFICEFYEHGTIWIKI